MKLVVDAGKDVAVLAHLDNMQVTCVGRFLVGRRWPLVQYLVLQAADLATQSTCFTSKGYVTDSVLLVRAIMH